MAITPYLAMTAAEYAFCENHPPGIAWMACHFSPYSTGLSNLPEALPGGSVLCLNDRTPICGHDPILIAGQLEQCMDRFQCAALLLDLQRWPCEETERFLKVLLEALPRPPVLAAHWAKNFTCPVFLPPCPLHRTLAEHIKPWAGRDLWLELDSSGETLLLTSHGCQHSVLHRQELPDTGMNDRELHCSYDIEVLPEAVRFRLWRNQEDLSGFLEEAENLGVAGALGLYQEFGR